MSDVLDVSVLKVLQQDLGKDSIAELVYGALRDVKDRFGKADVAIKLSDRNQVRYLAHSIKSNLSTCGALKAADIALILEQKSMTASMEQLRAIYTELEGEMKQAEVMILQYVTSPKNP